MKCPYVINLICDYPVSTGDIVCTTCPHYVDKVRPPASTPLLTRLLEKIKSLFR
jgi:hypothetical protein